MKKAEFTTEERKILDSFEKGEWVSVPDKEVVIRKHQSYARNTLLKDKRINIRISSKDLEALQLMAVEDGLPYQTLISSILHRYVSGRFEEKPRQYGKAESSSDETG